MDIQALLNIGTLLKTIELIDIKKKNVPPESELL